MTDYKEMLAQLTKPLAELVEARRHPQYSQSMETRGIIDKGSGMAITAWGDVQLGGNGAVLACHPGEKTITIDTNELHHQGMLRLYPGSMGRVLDINSGDINAALLPPITTPLYGVGTTFGPRYALVLVESATSALPTQQAATDLSKDIPIGLPGKEGLPTKPYVNIPPHTHSVQVDPTTGIGETTGVISWTGNGVDCPVPLHGIIIEYLFGYNRMHEIGLNIEQDLKAAL